MLQNAAPLLLQAAAQNRYIPAFNIYNLESITAAIHTAVAVKQPVILSFSAAHTSHASFPIIQAMAHAVSCEYASTAILHLDHCRDLQVIQAALDAGFTSVMFDGSALPLAENIEAILKVRQMAIPYGASVEGELGGLNDENGTADPAALLYTDPAQAKYFVQTTKVDSLAVSIGNAHGQYHGAPSLQWQRLRDIHANVACPLVLHGSTGISRPDLQKAACNGIAKINVNTAIAMAAADAAGEALQTPPGARYDYVSLYVQERMAKVMRSYYMVSTAICQ